MQTEARVMFWDIYGDILGGFYLPGTAAEFRGKSLDELAYIARIEIPETVMGWELVDTNPWDQQQIPY